MPSSDWWPNMSQLPAKPVLHWFPKRSRRTPYAGVAMALLRRGVDLSVIALWLGHESTETTQIYLHADMQLKERALAHASPSGLQPARFRPKDALLAFLESL